MTPYEIISKKRDGQKLTSEEITYFINGYTCGNIPDYQMSALLMAIYLNGMSAEETMALTYAYLNSGQRINLTEITAVIPSLISSPVIDNLLFFPACDFFM